MRHVGRLSRGASRKADCLYLNTSRLPEYSPSRIYTLRRFSSNLKVDVPFTKASHFWAPTGGIEASQDDQGDTHALLVRAGYLRQAHSGIFHLLPLGNRVQQKLERLVDKHMTSVEASKVSLSSISSQQLWQQSGRFDGRDSELFQLSDRRKGRFLLAPTHEEEITELVASTVKSYKDLPLRLYQVSRKYRDEQRPRQGLLRGREFVMKDLYTFDSDESQALQTYDSVRKAYDSFFNELTVPYATAEADSGNMGGKISHEYHFISERGEDNLIQCKSCRRTINDELAIEEYDPLDFMAEDPSAKACDEWLAISRDRKTLVKALFPRHHLIESTANERRRVHNAANVPSIKAALPDIDLDLSIDDPEKAWLKGEDAQRLYLTDPRVPPYKSKPMPGIPTKHRRAKMGGKEILLTRAHAGDNCKHCKDGKIDILPAIEIGHTFHLGTRYSKPLNANVLDRNSKQTAIHMGCHGIGISRLIGAVASILADGKGLIWPTVIAPFSIAVIPGQDNEVAAADLCRDLQKSLSGSTEEEKVDILYDDRNKRMGWKLNDADLIGYPIIIVVGRAFGQERKVEVQCRRLGFKEVVVVPELPETVSRLLKQV